MENYLVVSICYGCGCFFAYRLGWHRGGTIATKNIIDIIAKHFKTPPTTVSSFLLKVARQQMVQH